MDKWTYARHCKKLYWKSRRSPSGKDGWQKKTDSRNILQRSERNPASLLKEKESGTALCRTTSHKRKISIEHTLKGVLFLCYFLSIFLNS